MVSIRKLRVVSFNIFYSIRSRLLLRTVPFAFSRLNPDIIALQEVWDGPRHHFARDLAGILGFHFLFVSRTDAPGRRMGLAFLARERPLSCETFQLPYSRSRKRPRILQVAQFSLHGAGWFIAHTHLESLTSRENRESQLEAAVEVLRSRAEASPLVLTGDFNTRTKGEVSGFREKLIREGFAMPSAEGHTWRAFGLQKQLDWIATRDCDIAASGVLDDVRGSDHRPVWADVIYHINER